MADYLVTQAIRSVWCAPAQDKQNRLKLAKITRYGGVYTKVDVMWEEYSLPLMGQLFHVYQVGGISPRHLGLTMPARAGIWINMAKVCIDEETVVDLYNVDGVQSPRSLAWYTISEDGNLVVAVQRYDKVPIDYNNQALYMRVYHNAYFGSARRNNLHDYIDVKGGIMRSTDEIIALQNAYNSAAAKGGTYAFVNGFMVDQIDLVNVQINDVAEFVYDGSIYGVEDFNLIDLNVFDSTLDAKRKYLLHPAVTVKNSITYQDDVDVFVIRKQANGRFKGLYYHRNEEDAFRQVTHADYSIAIPYLSSFMGQAEGWENLADLTVRILVRKSGYDRPLINEANRIKELYKLPNSDIEAAMVGVDALVPEWQAAHLEAAEYTRIMRSGLRDITPKLTQDAMGYNSMAMYLAPTPQFVLQNSGQALVDIPVNLQFRSTVYEFDYNGHLLGWYPHNEGALWRAQNADTHMVQIVCGYGTSRLDEKYNHPTQSLDANLDYRMYTCGMFNGAPDNKWVDVTGSDKYTLMGRDLTWLTSAHTTYTMVRSNKDFLGYNLNLPVQRGVLRFLLISEQDRGLGSQNTIMQIQMGELDLWLNGRALVEGIDYLVNFPEVVIINKKFINHDIANQLITVRHSGHCKSDLSRAVLGDRGFVSHGVLSNNTRFDLRDDKVQHISVAGGVYARSELAFAETHSGVNVVGVPNGAPYVVRDIVVPLRGTTDAKTYEARDAALVVDQHVSDYLSLRMPPPVFTEPDVIPELYPVYSPFVSALIDDLKTNLINDQRIYAHYNDDVVQDICAYYEPLLAFDPTRDPNKADADYVSVQAYYRDVVTELDIFKYRFLQKAVSLYLNNAVNLSHFVMVTA